jgi:tellurite resistance protein
MQDLISVRVTTFPDVAPRDYRLPPPPAGFGNASWIPAGTSIAVDGLMLPGGMIYVGTSLPTPYGGNDPCLINPSKSVAKIGDFHVGGMGYWPSYSEITPTARRAYLNWLADGCKDPEADLGYVFLFFYGLERRAVLDAAREPAAKADLPAIETELRRLIAIYGDRSGSFRRYATDLLNWVSLSDQPPRLYEKEIPAFERTYELPIYVRLALGQTAVDGVPIPAHLALAWIRLDPTAGLRTPAIRCAEQFGALFERRYADAFGTGLVLPRNRTKLQFAYRAASAGFRGYNDIRLEFGETPDVAAQTAPMKKLLGVVETVTEELEPYSRFIGRNAAASDSLEALTKLPLDLWPQQARKRLTDLGARAQDGPVIVSSAELCTAMSATAPMKKDTMVALTQALRTLGVGLEPDVTAGGRMPKPDSPMAVFALPAGKDDRSVPPTFRAASLTLQLASAVAASDGDFSKAELTFLSGEVRSWTSLAPAHIARLLAQLHLAHAAPPSLASLKKQLEPLVPAAKEAIARYMATVAQNDGVVTPDEVKLLERVYKVLGVDPQRVFSDLHMAGSAGEPTSAPRRASRPLSETGFKLDAARIASLQKDTEKTAALLAEVFQDEATEPPPVDDPEVEAAEDAPATSILGLDEAHAALARLMLSRPEWTHSDLADAATDLELMLDGALERINDAAFEAYAIPFVEGTDPLAVNSEILEKIAA